MRSYWCMCCNRPLSVSESIERGLGPICAARKAAEVAANPHGDKVDLPFDPVTKDVVVERRADGLHFNIYQVIYHHSPTGFEIGYQGSGPADFALNILELFLRESGERATLPLRDSDYANGEPANIKICEMSWHLHQDFKREFIATMPRDGGTIRGDDIRRWILEQKAKKDRYALAA